MSRISAPRLLALGAFAFLLRGGMSYATSVAPILPAYNYADATSVDDWARATITARKKGTDIPDFSSTSHRLQVEFLISIYSVFGESPLAAKLIHAATGAASCVLLAAALSPLFGAASALVSAVLLAAWPSAVFGSSQILKDPLVNFFAYTALWALLPLLGREKVDGARTRATLGATTLVLAGCFRSYIMIILAASFAAAALWSLRRGRPGARAALVAAVLTPGLYVGFSHALFSQLFQSKAYAANATSMQIQVIPKTYDPTQTRYIIPISPLGITEFRMVRQAEDQKWSIYHEHRVIATQIYPDARFKSWLDVAVFIPKASFQVLFMPLPGLYPIDGKMGRLVTAGENIILLLLAVAAALGIRRLPLNPPRAALLGVFLCMTIGSALLEFDLGSATRHKAFYFPMLFPFAAAALLGRRRVPEAYR
ncbi:MAG: hypothetical protein ABL955_11460 [Elusimicrobiota bacterium]